RERALASLDRALAGTHVLGVVTNTAFLRALLGQDEVVAGTVDTGLIERRLDHLARPAITARALAVAALVRWDHVARSRPDDLWHAPTGWRLGEQAPFVVRFEGADGADEPGAAPRAVELTGSPAAARARVAGEEISLALHPGAVTVDGHRLPLIRHGTEEAVWIGLPGEDRELTLHSPRRSAGVRDAVPTLQS